MSLTVDSTTLISTGVEVENGQRFLSVWIETAPRVDVEKEQDTHLRFTQEGLTAFGAAIESCLLLNSVIAQQEEDEDL